MINVRHKMIYNEKLHRFGVERGEISSIRK